MVDTTSPDAPDPSAKPGLDKSHAKLALTGTVGAAAGVFSFSLLGEMGMPGILEKANNPSTFIPAVTLLSLLLLVILVAGYLVLTGGAPKKTAPAFWAGIGVFGVVALVGFGAIVLHPGASVMAYVSPGSDFSSLTTDPSTTFTAYLDDDLSLKLQADKSKAIPVHSNDGTISVGITNFDKLRAQLAKVPDLRNQTANGVAVGGWFAEACQYVPVTAAAELQSQCKFVLAGYQQP